MRWLADISRYDYGSIWHCFGLPLTRKANLEKDLWKSVNRVGTLAVWARKTDQSRTTGGDAEKSGRANNPYYLECTTRIGFRKCIYRVL